MAVRNVFQLAVSNIGWDQHDDPEVLGMLRGHGIAGIEVAPSKIWPGWEGATTRAAAVYATTLANEGFAVPALQAIFYDRPDLSLFHPPVRAAFVDHIRIVADLAAAMHAKVLVFGAPKNRRRGPVGMTDALAWAADVLREAATQCAARGVCLGLEHNPIEYGCDFLTNVADVKEFVARVDSPGLGLHLDAGGMHLSGGGLTDTILHAGPFVHYHASEPMLEPLSGGVVDHVAARKALEMVGYGGWISLEMKPPESAAQLIASVLCLKNSYADESAP